MQKEIELRKKKWIDFYDPNSNTNRIAVISYTEGMPECPPLWWEKAREREEWAYKRYLQQMEDMSVIHDNTIPFMSLITGTEIFAEAFGCEVYKPEDSNPFALPKISSWQQLNTIKKPKLEDTNLTILFDMADRLKARAGSDALISLPDIQTPMDIASLIWDKNDIFIAMYENPQAVKELSAMVKEFMFEFFDEWFRRYGKEIIAHYPDYYMPYGITMSEDEIGSVSSDMFKEFFQKELHQFAEHYGAIGIHCCANSMHQWENFRQIPNLKILNFCLEKDNTLKYLDYFRNTCGLYPDYRLSDMNGVENAEEVHLAQHKVFNTKEEAIRAADYFAEYGVLPNSN